MAKSQKQAIQQELLDRATGKGKEPTWEGIPSKLQLVSALNFYSSTVEPEKLQSYAIAWAKKFSPNDVELISAQTAWKFQTVGALMRIVSRGLQLSKPHLDSINKFVKELEMPVVKEVQPTKSKGKKKMTSSENVNYRNFCDALDKAVEAKGSDFKKPKLEVDKDHPVTPVIEVCERELASMKEDPTIYPADMNKWFRAVIKLMNSADQPAANKAPPVLKKAAKPAAVEAKKPAPKPAPKPTVKKSAAKPAPAPKADEPAANDDHILNGKTQAFLFDTRYGRLTRLIANKGGFKVKGKTIYGIDEKKSKVALLKNFGDAMKVGAANDDLETWMTKCVKKGNPINVGGRLSDGILILNAA